MKKKYSKRLLALMLSICFMVPMVYGCSSNKAEDVNGSSDSTQTNGMDTDKAGSESKDALEKARTTPYEPYPELVTYTLGMQVATTITYPEGSGDTSENNAYTRLFKEKLNIQNDNVFEAISTDDYNQKVTMAITSGDIPDIMRVDYATFKELVANDMLADLTESYKNCASDLMKEIYASNENRSLDMATFDGKLYAIPTTSISSGQEMFWVRGDWMDKLGLKEPKTMEDIENILLQFVSKDPGGKGNVGLALVPKYYGSYAGGYQANNIFTYFGSCPKQWIKGKDGTAVYGTVQPETKQGLQVLSDWYGKGLIDKEMAVRKEDDIKALLTNGQCGAFFAGWWAPYHLESSFAMDPKAEWRAYIIPAGEDGKVTMFAGNPNQNYTVVRKGFKYPEMIIKAKNVSLDYNQGTSSYTDTSDIAKEYLDYVNNGYGVDPVGGFDYYNAAALAYEHISEAIEGKRKPQDMILYENTLYNSCMNYLKAIKNKEVPASQDWLNYTARMVSSKLMYETEANVIQPVFFDQTDSMKLMWTTLQTMEEEAMLKILTGEEPLDYFDKFVSQWKASGGDQITKEVNEAIK